MNHYALNEKISQLQQATEELSQRYQTVATQLANLQSKPDKEPLYQRTISDLQNKLAHLTQEHEELLHINDSTAQKLSELISQNNNQSKMIEHLAEENKVLKQKNRMALERTELIQEWLQHIDNGTANH